MNINKIEKLARLIRYYILVSSTEAASGHPTSSLSAADLMTVLMFGRPSHKASEAEGRYFKYDFSDPHNSANDRLIFSKGHATPLFYSLYLAANVITPAEIMKVRKFDSHLEGHPTPRFKFTEASTGSLGQGLSIGVGLALGQKKLIGNNSRTYVLLGDGEMAEGSVWEAANIASYYRLNNLTAIADINRLGQSQETSLGWDLETYKSRFEAFGWKTIVINGHDYNEIEKAYNEIQNQKTLPRRQAGEIQKPTAIIAKTIKGKGVSFLENKEGWHGKPLKKDELEKALIELGEVDLEIRGEVGKPVVSRQTLVVSQKENKNIPDLSYKMGEEVATRKAYGNALKRLGESFPNLVVLDAEVKNSTYAEIYKEAYPDRFFEMFIAEQNMAGTAVGLCRLGFIPFVSTFACFLTRAFDQIRMASLSEANIKFCGSHAGVSIGEDGPSQMGLEDLAMFRTIHGSVVLYPADAVSTEKLVKEMADYKGISYIRTSRPTTPVIYENGEEFRIGGSKVHPPTPRLRGASKKVIIVAAGVTLYEALKAQEELIKEGIEAIVVDCYSIKPIDKKTLTTLARAALAKGGETVQIITVEDHWFEGGLGDAVLNVFAKEPSIKIHKLAVSKMPRSGKPAELMAFEEIDANAIIAKAKLVLA